jgi:hypothetical protein
MEKMELAPHNTAPCTAQPHTHSAHARTSHRPTSTSERGRPAASKHKTESSRLMQRVSPFPLELLYGDFLRHRFHHLSLSPATALQASSQESRQTMSGPFTCEMRLGNLESYCCKVICRCARRVQPSLQGSFRIIRVEQTHRVFLLRVGWWARLLSG